MKRETEREGNRTAAKLFSTKALLACRATYLSFLSIAIDRNDLSYSGLLALSGLGKLRTR